MKIKGVIEDFKIFLNDSKNISRTFLWWCCGQCGVSLFSDSFLVWLIFLRIYRPLPMYSVLTTGF